MLSFIREVLNIEAAEIATITIIMPGGFRPQFVPNKCRQIRQLGGAVVDARYNQGCDLKPPAKFFYDLEVFKHRLQVGSAIFAVKILAEGF